MSEVKVIHYQNRCIGCGACAGMAPTVFKMETVKNANGAEEIKSVLIDGEKTDEETFTKVVASDPMVEMLSGVCPAAAIEVETVA